MMLAKLLILAAAFSTTQAETISGQYSSQVSLKAMEKVFARSEKAHAKSMTAIMRGLSSEKAWNVLKKNNLTNPGLIEMTSQSEAKQTNLRKNTQPKGYSG